MNLATAPVNNPVGSVGLDLVKEIAGNKISQELEENIKANIDNYDPPITTSGDTVKRTAETHLLKSLEMNGEVDVDDFSGTSLVNENRIINGEHEVYSRERSESLDNDLDNALKDHVLTFKDGETKEAKEYLSNYKEGWESQYGKFDYLRADNPKDYKNINNQY